MNSNSKSSLAIPFITYHEKCGFALSVQAEQFLCSLDDQRQLGVVSIVGKYRTGKSFFVNRVLLDQKKGGFQVGPTINPCTKGLWLWKKVVANGSCSNMDCILIDTEGFGGMDENANHDSRIFLFSLLLSSYFIYNSVGSIDENALNTLNLIINLAKDIHHKTNRQGEQSQLFPSFMWIVRDFTLQMVDRNEKRINSKQYLQNALEFQKGNSESAENKNKIRRLLKHFFHDRDCEVMVRPSQNQKDLQRLDDLQNSQLRPEFVHQVETIRAKIFKKVKPKSAGGKGLNGRLFVALCKGYMEAINKGELPNVETAWFYVCRQQGRKAIDEAQNFFRQRIALLDFSKLSAVEFQKTTKQLRIEAEKLFRKKSLGSEGSHLDLVEKLQRKLQQELYKAGKKHHQQWEELYQIKSQQIIQKLRTKIYLDGYKQFSQFVQDFQKIKKQYNQQTKDGDPTLKWKKFNQLSQDLYKLAGEVSSKNAKQLQNEKVLLEQKLHIQQEQMEGQLNLLTAQNQLLRTRTTELQKQNQKLSAVAQTAQSRGHLMKDQHESLYTKYKILSSEHQQTLLHFQKLKKEHHRITQKEAEATRQELISLKNHFQKQRNLFQLQKKYSKEEKDRIAQKYQILEQQNKKLRSGITQSSNDLQQLQQKCSEKEQQIEVLQQTNASLNKRVEHLMQQNSRKNDYLNEHNDWLLEKSYLENQISFLKNTLQQNKRLHDTLLVTLQQSLSSKDYNSQSDLLEANRNLSVALQKKDSSLRSLEDKYDKLRQYKKLLKHCASVQCSNCSKHIHTSAFELHLESCLEQQMSNSQSKEPLQVSVAQNICHEGDERKKPYTEYIVQVIQGDKKWKIAKRYKQFTQLQHTLINAFPTIKYPPSCNFLADINNLVNGRQKNALAEERKRSIQQYLRDLIQIQEIRKSDIFMNFLEVKKQKIQKKGKQGSARKEQMLF